MNLSEKIRRLRDGRPYAEIGRAGDCSAPTIRELESGVRRDPSVRLILRLARYFRVSVDWLADDSADWPPPETSEKKAASMVEAALTGAGLSGELTEDDREMLRLYRLLPDEMKRKAEGYLIGLVHGGTVEAAKFGAEVNSVLNHAGDGAEPKE